MSQSQRQMTVLFADVAGSARLYERLGDLEAAHAADRCLKRISRCVEAFNGRTLQIVGDELLAVFDSAEEGCLAAIEMQTRIADLPPVSGLQLAIRIGLHVGMVIESGDNLTGMAVISAARITGMANRDQILISGTLLNELSKTLAATASLQPGLGQLTEGEASFQLHALPWQKTLTPVDHGRTKLIQQLHLSYHNKTFMLDKHSPPFTLGRDLDSHLLIKDRKGSRKHARIEYRAGGFVYIDCSTNGSFIKLKGQAESLLRNDSIPLDRDGQICFGTSRNDPDSDGFTFEFR